jgi:hypothetical protein
MFHFFSETGNMAEGSVRQYLERIFEKTGAKRQIDLIRAIGETLAQADFAIPPPALAPCSSIG